MAQIHALPAAREATLENILTAVKSKRYTRTRLDRMMMCAYLGIAAEILAAPVPYIRVLAFNEKGRAILSAVKKSGVFRTPGANPPPLSVAGTALGRPVRSVRSKAAGSPGREQRRRIVLAAD